MSFQIDYPRVLPEARKKGFFPSAPKFQVRWDKPVSSLVCDYIAVQHRVDDSAVEAAFFDRLKEAFDSEWGPDCHECMQEIDEAGMTNSIVIGYWTSPSMYAMWKHGAGFNAWFRSSEREQDSVAYWRETLTVPLDRFETIFSEPTYRAGLARTSESELAAMLTAGYFGAMRDRLPLSAIDPLDSPYGDTVPAGDYAGAGSKRVRIDVPHNVVSIRSGQFWEIAKDDQLDDYIENLQPKLDVGMRYLEENKQVSGCLSLRSMQNLDDAGSALKETSKHLYFLSLGHLERWAHSHVSHLDIYQHALAMRRKYGAARSVVTWHEVLVLGTVPSFEYIGCHGATGLLRFANVWGHVVQAL